LGCRSAGRLSKRITDDCGRARTCPAAPAFNSPCRRSQALLRDAALVSRPKEPVTRPRVLLWVKAPQVLDFPGNLKSARGASTPSFLIWIPLSPLRASDSKPNPPFTKPFSTRREAIRKQCRPSLAALATGCCHGSFPQCDLSRISEERPVNHADRGGTPMTETMAAVLVFISIGIFLAHAYDAYRMR
jgi:hypothetical protein